MPETPLLTYLRIQRAQDRQMMEALRKAAASIESELRRLQSLDRIGAGLRREQLLQSQAAINRQLAQFWESAGDTIQANSAKAAAAGAETILRESKPLLRAVLSEADYDYMMRSAQESAERGRETLSQRVSGSSYVPLAESVYDNSALSQGKIDDIVNSALARGASAAELARDVRGFINPNTPGGVRYASMRLGRTELNNAFHASQIKQAQDEPWTLAVHWHLSGSHPKPDACNDYADDVHFVGGEPGQWKPEEVPGKPHPNCLCYTTPDTMDPDEFIEAFSQGKFDKYLDDELGVDLPDISPESIARSATTKSVRAPTEAELRKAREDLFDPEELAFYQRMAEYADDTAGLNSTLAKKQYEVLLKQYEDAVPVKSRKLLEDAYFGNDDSFLINAALRSGDEISEAIQELRAASRQWELTDPVTVHRGMWDMGNLPDDLTGAIWDDAAFQSTTFDRGRATTWAQSRGHDVVIMDIVIPRGTRVAMGSDQMELLIPDGAKIRIVSDSIEMMSGSRVRVLKCLVEAV